MEVPELLERVSNHLSVGRAFGPAYEHDGAMIIPVAIVAGGGGGGMQPDDQGTSGGGGGLGGVIYPLGAYVARQGHVRFVPSFDATSAIVGILGLLRIIAGRRRSRRETPNS